MAAIRRFPAVLWIPMYAGSLFILFVGSDEAKLLNLGIGLALAAIPTAWAGWLAFSKWRGHPRPQWLLSFVGATVAFYAVITAVVWATSGTRHGIAAALAALFPLAAAALWVASARTKTVAEGGELRDSSASDHTDPFPGIGASDNRPMGDSADVHDEISPHDLPKGHPGRAAAARIAREQGGTTRGHREGGAVAADEPDLVGADEEDGARVDR